jgi:hypothetical protein
MPDSRHPAQDVSTEITAFITEGIHCLATISTNDYGFLTSARMAQTYLLRATRVLEAKHSFDRAMQAEISQLKTTAEEIACQYAQFETFCADCDRFNHLKTKDRIEWFSKCAVRVISGGYLGTASYHLAHKIRTFHTRVCSLLIEK